VYLCRCRAFALPMLCLCSAFAVPLRYLCPAFAVPLRCLCSTIRRRLSFGRSEDGRCQSVYCMCSPHVSWSRVVSGHRGHLPLPTTLNHSTTQPSPSTLLSLPYSCVRWTSLLHTGQIVRARSAAAAAAAATFHARHHHYICIVSSYAQPAACAVASKCQMHGYGGALPTSWQPDSSVEGFTQCFAKRSRISLAGRWSRSPASHRTLTEATTLASLHPPCEPARPRGSIPKLASLRDDLSGVQ
jgi:hypothetical protein